MTTKQNILYDLLRVGVDKNDWGYSTKSIAVSLNKSDPMCNKIPYTFTTYGFKNQKNQWYVILKMNVDQISPIKKQPFNETTDIHSLLNEMMHEFIHEYINQTKHNYQ